MQYSFQGDFDPQVGWPHPTLVSRTEHAAFCVPKYSAKLGVGPQADFADQLEFQGLLGSAVLCHPSGASWVLDRYTP